MKRSRLQPLVLPTALLGAGGVTALLAEATARSVETVSLFGLVKLVSDLVLLIAGVWLTVALIRIARLRPARPRA